MLHQIIDSLCHRFRQSCLLSLCVAALSLHPASVIAQEVIGDALTITVPGKQGGALFKISRGDQVVYLFGTIHVGKADFFPLAPEVMQVLAQASKVAVEIDSSNPQLARLVQKYALYPAEQTLTDDIPHSLFQRITALLQKFHVPPTALPTIRRMKPWMLATQLGLYDYANSGFKQEDGVDNYLIAFAKEQHKPIISLERIDDQLALLGDMSMSNQVKFLQDSVDILQDPARANTAMELVRLWQQGDLDGLEKLMQEMANDGTFSGTFMQKALLDGRNPGLADGIVKMMNEMCNE
ncbi:MAG: TraB/GumN family protein, partial [Glaciimonas sp.]|nr:TraB/GumN family protein [Glaciimonas sp.]